MAYIINNDDYYGNGLGNNLGYRVDSQVRPKTNNILVEPLVVPKNNIRVEPLARKRTGDIARGAVSTGSIAEYANPVGSLGMPARAMPLTVDDYVNAIIAMGSR